MARNTQPKRITIDGRDFDKIGISHRCPDKTVSEAVQLYRESKPAGDDSAEILCIECGRTNTARVEIEEARKVLNSAFGTNL